MVQFTKSYSWDEVRARSEGNHMLEWLNSPAIISAEDGWPSARWNKSVVRSSYYKSLSGWRQIQAASLFYHRVESVRQTLWNQWQRPVTGKFVIATFLYINKAINRVFQMKRMTEPKVVVVSPVLAWVSKYLTSVEMKDPRKMKSSSTLSDDQWNHPMECPWSTSFSYTHWWWIPSLQTWDFIFVPRCQKSCIALSFQLCKLLPTF